MQIIPEQLNALDLQVDVGQIQTTVTVSDTTEALDTETATVSGTVTSNQIEHMPSFGRDVQPTNCYTAYGGTSYGSALPPSPGVRRNSLEGPGYRDVDVTLAKAFGLPDYRVLGENAKLELRVDAYNIFNNLNFKPDSIVNNIDAAGFGRAQNALAARTVTLTARFSF